MYRRFLLLSVALTVAFCAHGPLWAARNELIPDSTLAHSGLTRSWFAQVELDQGRARVSHVALREGVLYVQTDTAMVHAIDAETGRTLWSKQVGNPNHPSMPLDANGDLVAVVNGSRLYLLNRANGDILDEKTVPDAPGSGPALSAKRVYVPGVMGMVTAYRLPSKADAKDEAAKSGNESATAAAEKTPPDAQRRPEGHGGKITPPLFCKSFGRVLVQPLVTRDFVGGEYIVWPTDRGNLNLARVERTAEEALALKYRMETAAPIVARPAYLPPDPKVPGDAGTVFATSCDGFVYAIQEETGDTLWRFSTGEPILRSPAVIDLRVYVTTELGGMYCLDATSGKNIWWAENVMQFVAASKARVYVVDRIGRLRVLSAASGAQLDAIPTETVTTKMANTDTDRIYLVSDGGLVQCLREVEQIEPIMHGKERKEAAKTETQPPVEKKEKSPKKEHAAPKPPTTPKAPAAPKKKEPAPAKSGKKAAGNGPLGGAGNAKPPKGAKPPANNNANPF
jgi:outer membrane protein assembly factor BamB